MTELSERQQSILDYVIWFKLKYDGQSPSRRQIGAACNITSTSVVTYNLFQLEHLNKIVLGEGARNIRVVGGMWSMTTNGQVFITHKEYDYELGRMTKEIRNDAG